MGTIPWRWLVQLNRTMVFTYLLSQPTLIIMLLGLLILQNNNNPTTCNHTIHNWNLWLSHIYHISNENLTHINKDYHLHLTSKSIYVCDTCFYAKLKRLPSHNSFSSSLGYFDLIHMDIWDHIPTPSMLGHKYLITIIDDHNIFC